MKKQTPLMNLPRCIPIDLGEGGSGYVLAFLKDGMPTHETRATHIEAYMLSGPYSGQTVLMSYTPDIVDTYATLH
jgi:hypothetical protein